MQQPVVVRLVGPDLAEPAHRGAVELQLVDRLPGADAAQLRRPVRGQHDQRHAPSRRPRRSPGGSWPRRCPRCRGSPPARRSPARRRGRRRRRSARRRSPSPRSPAAARAPAPAGSSASRGRGRRGAGRSAPAPRRRPRRGRCCGWSGPCGARYTSYRAEKAPRQARDGGRRAPPRRSRRRGPGPAGGWSRSPRSSHSTEATVEAKRRWVARPWARQPLGAGRSGVIDRLAQRLRRPVPPRRSRPARRARWRGRRAAPRRSRSPPRARRPWRA